MNFKNTNFYLFALLTFMPIFFICSGKCHLLFTSAAYIQVLFSLDFIIEAYTMHPDQIAHWGQSYLIWVNIVCNLGYPRR